MKNRLVNKRALITGATSGIGKACAKSLASMGVNLTLLGRNKEKLETLKDEFKDLGVDIIVADVREKETVMDELKSYLQGQKVDILINNAGLALGLEPLDEGSLEQWDEMIDANIKGLLYVSRAVIPAMREQNSGHIINIGSIAGRFAYPNGSVYCATKRAVHSLSESMNNDLYGTKIRVANIAPGAVETNFSKVRFSGDEKKAEAVYDGFEPLAAEDVAELITYVLNTPEHVNIQDALIMPTAQRNPYLLAKE